MALTWPKPLVHFDLDVGGFDRAAWRMDTNGITSKSYPTPVQMDKMLGQKKEGVTIKFPKKLFGIKEVWQQVVIDYVAACQVEETQTVVIDSATQLWSICHRGRLQELQEIQIAKKPDITGNELRERLQPIEYGEPNDRMRSLIYTARSYKKHLVLTHYPRDVYAQRVTDKGIEDYKTGEVEPDGFKETQRLVDIVIWVDTDAKGEAHAKITRCGLEGLGSVAVGLAIEPSYDGVINLQESMRGE